jgi:acetylornithine deacetylase/succinyl-diaminopimelate desuccinylase-like protein/tetratricopeptide (TPR) repeat protein
MSDRSVLALVLACALVAVVVAGCAPFPPTVSGVVTAPAPTAVQRPRFEFTTTEAFSAADIPAYGGSHPEVYAHIEANRARHLENLRRWVRQPSVSAQNIGIQQMAEMLRDDLRRIGFQETEIVPTSGHPGVFGFYDAGASRTLAVYMMYDVQPVEDEGWQVGAFDGAVVEHRLGRVLMARGATNQKGPQRAFLNAVESIITTRGRLPVNLLLLAEGEEELGSPNYPEIIARYADRLRRADGVIFPFNTQSGAGDVSFPLGVKGIVYFELEARGGPHGGPAVAEIHGSNKAIVDSPVWRLAQALASLTSPDGNSILVPGYYDPIRPLTVEEQQLVNGMLPSLAARETAMREAMGVERWIRDLSGRELVLEWLFNTTLNINGIWGGYTGPGMKTILPHRATAKVDSRLVPNQTPDDALRMIRAHLDANGFRDVELRRLSGYPPAQTSVQTPLVQAALSTYNKYGLTPSVTPRIAGSAPYYVFTDLGLPMIPVGIGHGSGAHAPNEYMVVEAREGSRVASLPEVEKFYVDMLYALAEHAAPRGSAGAPVQGVSLLGDTLRPWAIAPETRARYEAQLVLAQGAVARAPANPDSIVWLGRRLAYLGRVREAIDTYTYGISLHPANPWLYRHRGHRYITARELDRAIADLERAAQLVAGRPDEIEPDGQPNARNTPIGTLKSNIDYHLALAYYLRGEFDRALPIYARELANATNDDRRVSIAYWYYLALRRLGRNAEAAALLTPITPELEVVENDTYRDLLLLFKGALPVDSLLASGETATVADVTAAYGVGAWHLVNGRSSEANALFRRIVAGGQWPAFGFIAAEAELARGGGLALKLHSGAK